MAQLLGSYMIMMFEILRVEENIWTEEGENSKRVEKIK
jgi:hypothetical protein